MRILFCRNTHDENGKLYWWLKNSNCKTKGLGVHSLKKDGNTFEEYIQCHIDYKIAFPDYDIPTYIELLEDLIKMIRNGLVFVKEKRE